MKRAAAALGLTYFAISGFSPRTSEKTYEEFKPHMRAVYQSLMNVFPYAFNKNSFAHKDQAKLIGENLELLAVHAVHIERLAKTHETGHSHMSFQLARTAQQATLKFKAGAPEQAQFYLEEAFNTCLSCHTSRTSANDSEFTLEFGKDVNWELMGGFGKARFLAFSRQFEKSLDEYERIFTSQQMSLEELLQDDPFVEYLILALRVKDEKSRVIKTFSTLHSQSMPAMIKRDIGAWLEAVKKIQPRRKGQDELSYARQLIAEGRKAMEFPQDRRSLVHSILASKELLAYLNQSKIKEAQQAEAYYELGLCELVIGSVQMAGDSGFYFEEAIRLSPKAEFAKKAFALYEEGVLFGYSGSGGIKLPAEEKTKLDALRALVQ